MAFACALPDPAVGIAIRLTDYVECHSRALGQDGFAAVGGSAFAPVLTALLTIFVALIGYRLILGVRPGLHDAASWTVRIGIVLALTASWPAFNSLIFRVAMDGPGEIAAAILPASGLGDQSALTLRIQTAYDAIKEPPTETEPDALRSGAPAPTPTATEPSTPPGTTRNVKPAQDPGKLGRTAAASLLLVTTLGATLGVRIAAGVLLALGPLFIAALLFDGTRGLFEGWIRALGGAALGAVGTAVVAAFGLSMIEVELAAADAAAVAGETGQPDIAAILSIVAVFALAQLTVLFACARVAGGFRLPGPWRAHGWEGGSGPDPRPVAAPSARTTLFTTTSGVADPRSRARAVADAVAASTRREAAARTVMAAPVAPNRQTAATPTATESLTPTPLGRSYSRTGTSRTGRAARRDALT